MSFMLMTVDILQSRQQDEKRRNVFVEIEKMDTVQLSNSLREKIQARNAKGKKIRGDIANKSFDSFKNSKLDTSCNLLSRVAKEGEK